MRYRELVSIMRPVTSRTAAGGTTTTWERDDEMRDLPATITRAVDEAHGNQMVTIEDRYNVVLAGQYGELRTPMAVRTSDGRTFDVDHIEPLVGGRRTRLSARLVESPT